MGPAAERQFDPRTNPENIPFISRILWERGKDFDPNQINRIVREESRPFEHETFGHGHRWYLGFIGGMRTKIDFYPNNRILFIAYNDSKGVAQERMYVVDTIGLGHLGKRKGIAFMSERDMKSEIVLVQTNGNFDEFHRRLTLRKQDNPLPAVQIAAVPEQPQWLSKTPAQLTKEDIESLFRVASSKRKRFTDRRREIVASANNFMTSLVEIIGGYQMEEDEMTALSYLKLRFIQGLKAQDVANQLGYSREHTSRTIRVLAMELLLKYTRKTKWLGYA